jgi:hypothetical protein
MQLFTGTDEKDSAADTKRQYRLEFTDLGGYIQIAVKDARDSQQTDEDGAVSSTAQTEQLRNVFIDNLE